VMPFNSALNPFLYTFNVLMEKRQKAQEMYLLKRLETEMCTEQSDAVLKVSLTVNKSTAIELIKSWYCEQVLTKEDILSCGSVKEITSVSTQSVSVIVILYMCICYVGINFKKNYYFVLIFFILATIVIQTNDDLSNRLIHHIDSNSVILMMICNIA